MQPSEPSINVECTLRQLGYPSQEDREDLWTKPRAALGVSKLYADNIEVVYWEGFPCAVIARDIQPEVVIEYLTGPAFSQSPPVAIVFDGHGHARVFKRDGDQFCETSTPPSWKQTLAEPPGYISQTQATQIIKEIAEGNRNWFQDPRSKKIVGVLPRIFPEGTVVLYELLQNAADSGASEAAFRLESENLLFSHNGFPFTENDVAAISFVNSSTKPLDTIGFMGIGFKAAFEISDRPEVHSHPFCFRFDSRQEGGELLPIPIDCTHASLESYSTFFKFPLREQARSLVADELERFDGRPLLYIGTDLGRIKTPSGDFHLRQSNQADEVKILEVYEALAKTRTEYAVFNTELEPSDAALQEFAESRNLEPSRLKERKQRVSIAIPLDNGIPCVPDSGHLQVYLPTDVRLPLGFDVQGNFLVGASRKELRHASGPWNREHFQTLPGLVADVLEWAKTQALNTSDWAFWYDAIPDWQKLEEQIGLYAVEGEDDASEISFRSALYAELSKRKLVPVTDNQGSLVFVAPEDAIATDDDLQMVLSARELARLSGYGVLSPLLSQPAKGRLTGYIKRFGPTEFKASVECPTWESQIDAFSEGPGSRQGRRQLAKILAYLQRKWLDYPGDLGKCAIVLTENGKLRAADGRQGRRVHTLPDDDISFSTEELADHYDVVHQGFRRELNRPGEMDLDRSITRDAVRALELVAPTLGPDEIATDIILPLFQGESWQDIPDRRLFRYTRFLMQHRQQTRAAIEKSNIKLKVRGYSRQYLPPGQIYFGQEYSLDGERLDRLCEDAEGVHFLSGEYLEQAGGAKEDWVGFFSGLGVVAHPRVHTSTQQIPEWELNELGKMTEETQRTYRHLRVTPINDIHGRHYALDDFKLDSPILEVIQNLYEEKPAGWKDRLAYFAALLESGWPEYQEKCKRRLRYATWGSSYVWQKRVHALTTFARFLKNEPWLPVADDLHTSRPPSELVLNTEENRRLAHKETPFSHCDFKEPTLISFLNIQETPPETTPLLRLRYAVDRQEDNLEVFKNLYTDLASAPDLDANALRKEFLAHPLIFAPGRDPSYVTSKETMYASRTSLVPRMAAIKDDYPNLEEFFTKTLGIPTAESLEHFVEFLRDYVWKSHPRITDNLRSAVESCYRRFFNHLNETQDEAQEEALTTLLKEQLGSPTMVFCGERGWIDTTKTMVLYPDTRAYDGLLADMPQIAVESHLKRLAQPINEIRPLLNVLQVTPMSEAIRRVPKFGDVKSHPRSDEFGERLSLLVRKAVAIVEREAETESTSRNISLFLQGWRAHSESLFRDVRFLQSPLINIRYELAPNATLLREARSGAYVSVETDHLNIYMSRDLLEVFDAIADQLGVVLRLDLLPAGLREEVASLVQGNIARLELGSEQFGASLNRSLREKGLVVEEDEELKRILEGATKDIKTKTQAGRQYHVPGTESGTGSASDSTSDGDGNNSEYTEKQNQSPPKIPTSKEILAKLPEFDESSFGNGSAVDLSTNSQWQVIDQQSTLGHGSGGGSGGGGSFRSAQAYRDAYGLRGEQWVVERERRALTDAGRPDLAKRVCHRSKTHEGSPWDVESFEKSEPHKPIYIEVKSTSESDNFEVDMSVDQISTALRSSRPYYLYRVVDVNTSKPSVYIYNFRGVSDKMKFSATNVSVMLPKPKQPE